MGAEKPKVVLRLLRETDDLSELTAMLHRAYGPLADAGMRFLASHQDEQTTRERIADGECWVAVIGNRIVGTIVMYGPPQSHGCPWFERPEVAQFGQFAVEPEMQGFGIGSRLLNQLSSGRRKWGRGSWRWIHLSGQGILSRFTRVEDIERSRGLSGTW